MKNILIEICPVLFTSIYNPFRYDFKTKDKIKA